MSWPYLPLISRSEMATLLRRIGALPCSAYRLPGSILHGTASTKAMRLHATRESCDQGEITVLAIIETVLAVALLITLYVWFDRFNSLTAFLVLHPLCAADRWSAKASWVVYLPLVWLVNKARYRADEIQTVRRWTLGLTGGFLIVKVIVLMRVDDIVAAMKTNMPAWGLNILRTLHPYLSRRVTSSFGSFYASATALRRRARSSSAGMS